MNKKTVKIFNTDLDNTIIYSYKHDIGEDKIGVEVYKGRIISYVTPKTKELLGKIKENVLIVPTTTRTRQQYERINLGLGKFKYALICNGGILLEDGVENKEWTETSHKLIEESLVELDKAQKILEVDKRRTFELRFIDELFIFTKCNNPEQVVVDLKQSLDTSLVDVFNNGIKVYVVPKNLNKGQAIKRFKDYIQADMVITAGDSEFDISMLEAADVGIAPYGFRKKYACSEEITETSEDGIYSDLMLELIVLSFL